MKDLIILPILIPFVSAILCLMVSQSPRAQRIVGLAGATALFAFSVYLLFLSVREGVVALQVGSWPAPFGITLACDLFSAIMVAVTGLIGFAVGIYSAGNIDLARQSKNYFALFHFLLMGVCGAFLTGDIFNLYVWFEVLLIASFVLIVLGNESLQLEGAVKYVVLNLLSSIFFLVGIALLYRLTGTLNMADLALKIPLLARQDLVTTVAMLFLVAFGIKAAVFPLFFWLPASYHTPPVAVSAVFAGLLTKVGVYALIRVFTLLFVGDVGFTHNLIIVIAGFTMITGVLGAVAQQEFRRVLSFHIISQIGYMILGLGFFTVIGVAGSIFYIVHHIIVKTNLFLVSGVAHLLRGTSDLKRSGGLYAEKPLLGVLFLVPALSLAGIPPLSGFFSKLILILSGLELGRYVVVSVALVVGFLTLFSMTKIWNEVFWKPQPAPYPSRAGGSSQIPWLVAPIVLLALCTVMIGFGAQVFYGISTVAAEQLLDRTAYITAVLGPEAGRLLS